MASDNTLIRKLRVGDSDALRRSKFIQGTSDEVNNRVHKILENSEMAYVLFREDSSIAAVAVVRLRNSTGSSAELEILTEQLSTIYPSDNELVQIIDKVLYKCFVDKGIYKVSITISSRNTVLDKVLTECGFTQEAVLHAEYMIDGQYDDAGLYYMVAPEYKGYNVCFVPFQRGIITIYGSMDYVDRVEFNKYGGNPVDKFTKDAAIYMGLLDSDGKFLKRGAQEYNYDVEELEFLPYELVRAFKQLREYFSKDRESFDIKIRLTREITDFQRKVWDVLKTIPYGATYSYEDVALVMTNDNIKAARKLTRAVGSACSENPVPIFVPCHRVIGKDGKLVGFAGGVEFKDFLLQLEAFPAALL